MRNIFDKHNITDEIFYKIEKLIENTARKSSGTNSIWCHNKERAIELDKFIISCTFFGTGYGVDRVSLHSCYDRIKEILRENNIKFKADNNGFKGGSIEFN